MLTYESLKTITALPAAARDAAIAGVAGEVDALIAEAVTGSKPWRGIAPDYLTSERQAIAAAEAMRDKSGMVWTFAVLQGALFWRALGSKWRDVVVDVEDLSCATALSLAVALAILKEREGENGNNV